MKKSKWFSLFMLHVLLLVFTGCGTSNAENERNTLQIHSNYSPETKVVDVISDPVFQNYGRLIFPVDRHIDRNLMLKDAGDIFVWYNHIIPGRTVEIVNYMKSQAKNGNKIFYDIYTDEEKQKDPWKNEYGERI